MRSSEVSFLILYDFSRCDQGTCVDVARGHSPGLLSPADGANVWVTGYISGNIQIGEGVLGHNQILQYNDTAPFTWSVPTVRAATQGDVGNFAFQDGM